MPPGRKAVPYYKTDRLKGLSYSAGLHLILLLLAIFGLPNFMMSKPPEEPMAISVEILPISAHSNVKTSQQQPEEQKPEEDKSPPKKAPPVETAEETPPPPPERSILPKPQPKPAPKPPEPKPKPPKPNTDDEFKKLLHDLDHHHPKPNDTTKPDNNTSQSHSNTPYNPGLPMSMSEIDAIRSQIARCWVPPFGGKDAYKLVVTLRQQLASDGSVLKVDLTSESQARAGSDTFFRAAADSARRAVQECSPLKNLPPDKYATWRDIEMTFDPKEMLF